MALEHLNTLGLPDQGEVWGYGLQPVSFGGAEELDFEMLA